ncbi:MAG: hypothetical protein ACXVB4_17085 [Pseudobdellovibrionaceae bacterium]
MAKVGGGCAKLQELSGPTISQTYKLAWEREYLDLTELARLRWVEGWKIMRLADYFEISLTTVKERLRTIKKNPKRAGVIIPDKIIRGK